MNNENIIYLAGLIDGESYIGIKKTRSKHQVSMLYQERIQIRMVDPQGLDLMKEVFGGSYYQEKPHSDKGRPLYCYQASDKQAAKILTAVLPYLRIKRKVAETVLEFHRLRHYALDNFPSRPNRTTRQAYTRPASINNQMEVLYNKVKDLIHHREGGDANGEAILSGQSLLTL